MYSGIMKQEAIRQPENESDRQKFRKNRLSISRLLDNYFNQELHTKTWVNGIPHTKKLYEYCDTGLTYFYERNNVLQKLDMETKQKRKKDFKDFSEFDYMNNNEYIITIEYCANCEEHNIHTQHSAELFKSIAINLQKCILMRYPFIKIYLKTIDTNSNKDINFLVQNNSTKNMNDQFVDVRIGAFEVQLVYKIENKIEKHLLHSKLKSGNWPNLKSILNKIIDHVPRFDLEVLLYDASQSEEKKKNDIDGVLDSELEKIELKLYRFNNEFINCFIKNSKEEIDNHLNPHKRKQLILTQRKSEKESYSKADSEFKNTLNFTLKSSSLKKSTGFSKTKSFKMTNFSSVKDNSVIDHNTIDKYKGDYIQNSFSNKEGLFSLKQLPYDNYLIEIVESKNFLTSATYLNFNQIYDDNKIRKFISVSPQTNSFLEIYIYYNSSANSDDVELQLVPDARVIIERCSDQFYSDYDSNKIILKENQNIKGRFESILIPGQFLIDVSKKGFQNVKKNIYLHPGENKINIELELEKEYSLKISAYNYDEKEFRILENVRLKLCFGSTDITVEGMTNNEGIYYHESVIKEDFITLYACKGGYFPVQRTYIREREEKIEDLTKEIIIIMVKESLVMENDCIIMINYSNLFLENLEQCFQFSEKISPYIDITMREVQANLGVLTTYFKYHSKYEEETEEYEEFQEIIRIMMKIKNPDLLKSYNLDRNLVMNGLERFSCEICIYMNNNTFYIPPPKYINNDSYEYWDIGFLDVRNFIFYELGCLSNNEYEKNLFFNEWMILLQAILDKKIYTKMFEIFGFDKAILVSNDRQLYEPSFFQGLRNILYDGLSAEFFIYVCDMFKKSNKMISYTLLKRKIFSNLKNFKEVKDLKLTTFNTFNKF